MINYALNDTITLSSIAPQSSGTATLSSKTWQSDETNIRRGFLLTGTSGGVAVLTSTPGEFDTVVSVQVLESFTLSILLSGQWELNVPDWVNVKRFLPTNVNATKLLPEFFTAFSNFDQGLREIYDAVDRVGFLRRWDRVDPDFLSPSAELLGFYLSLSAFSTDQKRRLVQSLPYFYTIDGTDKTFAFLSNLAGVPITAVALWTIDYKTFGPPSNYSVNILTETNLLTNPDIFAVGNSYPTNHVQLQYDSTKFSLDTDLVTRLFYDISPVPWVLDSILGVTSGSTTICVCGNISVVQLTVLQ